MKKVPQLTPGVGTLETKHAHRHIVVPYTLQAPGQSTSASGSFRVNNTALLKRLSTAEKKGMWRLVSSLKKNELNISMTWWVFLLRGGRDCGENNFFNSLFFFFKTVIRIIYQMRGKEPRYLVSKTQVQKSSVSKFVPQHFWGNEHSSHCWRLALDLMQHKIFSFLQKQIQECPFLLQSDHVSSELASKCV